MLRFIRKIIKSTNSAYNVKNKSLLENYINDKKFPRLISFPRTGSHWLRMIMELYFEKPSLVEIYYYKKAKDFTCYHLHDIDLDTIDYLNVIYLYRDPVDTIYSQLSYYEENLEDKSRVNFWTEKYIKHLEKWLLTENFTTKKVIITYELLKNDINNEFRKICDFFDVPFDEEKLATLTKKITKDKLKQKTTHDNKVVNTSDEYQNDRDWFRNEYSEYIYDYFKKSNENIYNKINKLR